MKLVAVKENKEIRIINLDLMRYTDVKGTNLYLYMNEPSEDYAQWICLDLRNPNVERFWNWLKAQCSISFISLDEDKHG